MNKEIKLSNVSFNYHSNDLILHDLNYTFLPNNIYGIIGLSGSGKSTFCKLLANLILPSSGQVNYFDEITITNKKSLSSFALMFFYFLIEHVI